MAWLGAIGAVFLVLACLAGLAAASVFQADSKRRERGAGPLVAIVGLLIGATLLGLMGVAFVATSNSSSFGR